MNCSDSIERIEVLRHGRVRRAKLYYLRGLTGRAARIKERRRPLKASPLLDAKLLAAAEEVSVAEMDELEQQVDEPTVETAEVVDVVETETAAEPDGADGTEGDETEKPAE